MSIRVLACCLILSATCFAANKPDPAPAEIDKIIASFAENEAAFAKARENYTYRQTAKIQTIEDSGKFELVSDIMFNPDGKRTERVVRAPMSTLTLIQMSPEDEQDIRNVLPFVLTSKDIEKYHVRYLGRQNADEIPCYVFAVKPKSMQQGTRYFEGQIWVDDRDLMIVKTYGRSTGILKKGTDQQFPKFETFREQIDNKYWFPTYTIANSTLHFKDQDTRVRLSVKYEDYKQFKSQSTITFGESVEPKTPPATPKKP
jgi:outer membrane lipoprotein-sorting protein